MINSIMCSQFILNLDDLTTQTMLLQFMSEHSIGIDNLEELKSHLPNTQPNTLPYQKTWVLCLDKQKKFKLKKMQFSLIPSWSKEPKVKFASYNARIESVLDKPTWKKPFTSQHCLVPMNGFFESVYLGPLAGNTIEFFSDQQPLLFAAGIYDVWVDKQNGLILESFAILTRKPDSFILEHGHDRMPLFVRAGQELEWLNVTGAENSLQFLRSAYAKEILWNVRIFKQLKTGWEKRIPTAELI